MLLLFFSSLSLSGRGLPVLHSVFRCRHRGLKILVVVLGAHTDQGGNVSVLIVLQDGQTDLGETVVIFGRRRHRRGQDFLSGRHLHLILDRVLLVLLLSFPLKHLKLVMDDSSAASFLLDII